LEMFVALALFVGNTSDDRLYKCTIMNLNDRGPLLQVQIQTYGEVGLYKRTDWTGPTAEEQSYRNLILVTSGGASTITA